MHLQRSTSSCILRMILITPKFFYTMIEARRPNKDCIPVSGSLLIRVRSRPVCAAWMFLSQLAVQSTSYSTSVLATLLYSSTTGRLSGAAISSVFVANLRVLF